DGQATVTMKKAHEAAVGDQIKVIAKEGGVSMLEVSAIIDEKTFVLNNWANDDNIKNNFIYGKEIDDFHHVDYDRIFTLAVSAMQEMADKVERLEAEKSGLKTELDELNSRMARLEKMMTTHSGASPSIENSAHEMSSERE
ncbi:MAG: bZIP transcription factor, partial [Bacteroidota bacterium]